MTSLLSHPLIQKYFKCPDSCYSGESAHPFHMAYSVLTAMTQPIRKGERYLFATDGDWLENDCGEYLNSFHPRELRLPDRFQPSLTTKQECCFCAFHKDCPDDMLCKQSPHQHKPDPVDNVIEAIAVKLGNKLGEDNYKDRESQWFREKLRDLVRLARETK